MHEGVDGLLREKTRPPGIARTTGGKVAEVIRLTQAPPPHEATHWTIRAMGKAVGLAASTVRAIWKAHGLSPHRWRQFKLSNDPAFAKKLQDVVGLYVSPPAHAVVLSIDEKSQIQALDRTQPGLPLKKGRGPTMTHDYIRNGTTTLFAAFNVLDGSVIGRNMQRHRHQEFIRFLNQIERDVPAGKVIHVKVVARLGGNVDGNPAFGIAAGAATFERPLAEPSGVGGGRRSYRNTGYSAVRRSRRAGLPPG